MLFAAWVIYAEKQKGTLLSVRAASSHLPQLFAQNLLTSAVPAFLVFLALVFCKKRFVQAMQLTVPKGKTRKIAVLLLFLLLIVTAAALIVKPDKITVLYSLFYYTVFIAFCEEFVVRGVCVGLLRDEPAAVRYLVPNILFAAMHVFAYADFGAITASYLVRFCMLTNGGACRHGLPFPIPQRKIRLPVDPRPRARRFRLHSRVRLLKIPRQLHVGNFAKLRGNFYENTFSVFCTRRNSVRIMPSIIRPAMAKYKMRILVFSTRMPPRFCIKMALIASVALITPSAVETERTCTTPRTIFNKIIPNSVEPIARKTSMVTTATNAFGAVAYSKNCATIIANAKSISVRPEKRSINLYENKMTGSSTIVLKNSTVPTAPGRHAELLQ